MNSATEVTPQTVFQTTKLSDSTRHAIYVFWSAQQSLHLYPGPFNIDREITLIIELLKKRLLFLK